MCDKGTEDSDVERSDEITRQPRHTAATGETPDVSVSTVFDVLGDERRRAALTTLREAPDDQVPVRDLVSSLRDHPRLSLSAGEAALVTHHTVLPKLTEVGLVRHDARTESVRYVGHPLVDAALDLAANWAD